MKNQLQTINQKIAEKIGHELLDLIPAEEFQNMVDHEIHKFKEEDMPKIIREMITVQYKEHIKGKIIEFTCSGEYNAMTGEMVNQQLSEFLGKNMSTIFQNLFYNASNDALSRLNSSLQRY